MCLCLLLRLSLLFPSLLCLFALPCLPCQIVSHRASHSKPSPRSPVSLEGTHAASGEILQVNSCLVGSGPSATFD